MPGATTAGESEEANKEVVRRLYDEVLTPGAIEVAGALVTEGYFHRAGPGAPDPGESASRGIEAVRKGSELRRSVFPDLAYEILELLAEGDRVVAVVIVRGTHTGPGAGVEPTNREVELTEASFYKLRDGRIAESWTIGDNLKLSTALGFTLQPPG